MIPKQAIFEAITDQSDAIPLCPRLHLFLKPSARILITVQLDGKSKTSISNWQIMERLKEWIDPDKFSQLNVVKTSSELLKFDAELADRSRLPTVLSRLCNRRIRFPGITNLLIVHAVETKPDFPTRHDWDSYFRNNKDMNELKPGERPDTIHIENIPIDWLTEPGEKYPSEYIFKKIFNGFGDVARVDLPAADPSRVNHEIGVCDAYIQFIDYSAFVSAMDTFRGNKLAYITDTKALAANIKVDFDKSKHMTLGSITKRNERRDRFVMRKKVMEETERIQKEKGQKLHKEENRKKMLEMEKKLERQNLREEKRKAKRLKRLADKEADEMNQRVVTEEKLLLKAQRKLEAIQLLGELFSRIKTKMISKSMRNKKSRINKTDNIDNIQFRDIESTFRKKMIEKWKPIQNKSFKNFANSSNDSENRHNDDDNMNNSHGRDRGNSKGNRGKGSQPYAGRGAYFIPPIPFDPIQLISYGHKYHEYIKKMNKKVDHDRSRSRSQSKRQKRSSSSNSFRSYSRSRSQNRNYSRSLSISRSRSQSHSRNRSDSRSISLKRTSDSRSESKRSSRSRSRNKNLMKTTEYDSGHLEKKKSKKKKKKKHKKSKK